MSEVGSISLDLVIRDTIEAQLSRITAKAMRPAEKMSETISKVVSDIRMPDKLEFPEIEIPEVKLPETKAPEINAPEIGTAELERKFTETIDRLTAMIREKLGNISISADALKPFENELDIIAEKIGILLKKWQELSSVDWHIRPQIDTPAAPAAPAAEAPQTKVNDYGSGLSAAEIERVEKALDRVHEKISSLTEPVRNFGRKVHDTFSAFTAPVRNFGQRAGAVFDGISGKIRSVGQTAKYIFGRMTEPLDETGSKAGSVFDRLKEKVSGVASAIRSKLSRAASSAGNAVKKTLGGAFNIVKNVSSKALSSIRSGFGKLTAPAQKFASNLKRAFKSVFLMAGVYAAFRALKDGFAQAAKADEKFSESLNAVKANLAIAFQPIIQAVMPMLNTLMSGLASVTKSVAGFISGIFGKTYAESAQAAKKLQSTADLAKKTKLSMAGIDEMNVLSDDSSEDSGGIDYSKIDMTEPELPDWAERLKESIRSGDWSGVGALLAERVNSAFSGINWDKIRERINSGITKITDLINGFTGRLDWALLGDSVGEGINTVFSALYTFANGVNWSQLSRGVTKGLNSAVGRISWKGIGKTFGRIVQSIIDVGYEFVTGFDWKKFGTSIGDSINAFFESIDFAKAGQTFSGAIKGLLDMFIGLIQQTDWQQIGQKIAEFFSNIDYSGIATRFFELLGSALGATVSLIWGAIRNVVFAVRDYFTEKIEECGGNIVAGLWKGIKEAVSGAAKWIKKHVFEPFIDGFKKAFGIASPSKEMATMGGFIIDGLYNAISDGIKRIEEIFTKMREKIKEIFSRIHEWFEEKFSKAWELIKNVFSGAGAWFNDRWSDIKNVFSAVGSWFGDRFREAWDGITNIFSAVGSWFGDRWSDIRNAFGSIGTWFSEKFQSAYDGVTRIWSGLTGFFERLWSGISDGAKNGINWVIDKLNKLPEGIENLINGAVSKLNEFAGKAGKKVMETLGFEGGHLPTISIPRIPHLAKGGIATEPTLAMIGDNRNAKTDPEVVAPLSKLKGLSDNSEIVALLGIIIELLKSGTNIEIINYLAKDYGVLSREVLKIVNDDKVRRGE